jgi:hypothetical protein
VLCNFLAVPPDVAVALVEKCFGLHARYARA